MGQSPSVVALFVLLLFAFFLFPGRICAQTPRLSSISPSRLSPGLQVTLTGWRFGTAQNKGYVNLANSNSVPVVSWSNTRIVAIVPAGTTSGKAYVHQGGRWSNGVSFAAYTPSATLRATPVTFPSVQVGSSSTQSDVLTNAGTSTITISNASVTGSGFGFTGLNPPLSLSPGASITFTVTFAPKTSGQTSGDILIASNAADPSLPIPLTGVGQAAGSLTVTPGSASLGSVTVGSSKTMSATLNAAGAIVVVSSAITTSPEFTLAGVTFPMTIPSGQSAPVTVQFTPQSSGAASAKISLVSNASNSPAVASLTGMGVVASSQHSVDLSWKASASAVVGYKVYRGSQSGGPYSDTSSSLDPSTTDTDSSVQAGQAYYYVVTGVDAQGTESKYSNEVKAVVPSP